jgi:hypothetical protein
MGVGEKRCRTTDMLVCSIIFFEWLVVILLLIHSCIPLSGTEFHTVIPRRHQNKAFSYIVAEAAAEHQVLATRKIFYT